MTILFTTFFLYSVSSVSEVVVSTNPLPNWTLQSEEGKPIEYYKDSDESTAVILFWATWCPYCRTLMPHLQEVLTEYEGKPVNFYALNVWEDGEPGRYLRERKFGFTLLLNAEGVAQEYGVKGTPGLFVVDSNHRVLYKRVSGEDEIAVKISVREAIEQSLTNSN